MNGRTGGVVLIAPLLASDEPGLYPEEVPVAVALILVGYARVPFVRTCVSGDKVVVVVFVFGREPIMLRKIAFNLVYILD